MLNPEIGKCYRVTKEITVWEPTEIFPMITATQGGKSNINYWQLKKDTIVLVTESKRMRMFGYWVIVYDDKRAMIMLKLGPTSLTDDSPPSDPGDYLELLC